MFDYSVTSRAILLHCERHSGDIEVTSHEVIKTPVGYTLGAGQLFGLEQKRELAEIFSDAILSESLTCQDDRVIAQTSYAVAWYMPAQQRELNFRYKSSILKLKVKIPNAVGIMCRGDLYVACYKGKTTQKPSGDTPLYRAPLANMISEFQFCMGNIKIPHNACASNIDIWTQAIWETTNTHVDLPPVKGVSTPGEYHAFMKSIADTQRFPNNKLIPTGITLNELLSHLESRG